MEPNLAELEKQVREDPKMRRFYDLALEYQKSGKLDEALALCERGLERNPNQWQGRLLLAQLYAGRDRLDDAKTMAERVLMVQPENVGANHLIADIYFTQGNSEDALRHYRIVQLFEPGRTQVEERIRVIERGEDPAAGVGAGAASAPSQVPPLNSVDTEVARNSQGAQPPEETDPSETTRMVAQGAPENASEGQEAAPVDDSSDVWDMPDEIEDDPLALGGGELDEAGFLEPEEISVEAADEPIETDRMETIPPELAPDAVEEPWDGAERAEEATDPSLSTLTLAELYEKQGYPEKAIEIYQRILLKEPDNESVRDKIGQLMTGMAGAEPEGPSVQDEDVQKAIRKRRVETLEGWLRRIREGAHV